MSNEQLTKQFTIASKSLYQKLCDHPTLRVWRAGGRAKAQCLVCFDRGLESRLRREHRERTSEIVEK